MSYGKSPERRDSMDSHREQKEPPFFIGGCHSWRTDGPIVAEMFPQFATRAGRRLNAGRGPLPHSAGAAIGAAAETGLGPCEAVEHRGDDRIGQRHRRRDAEATADAHRFAMHEAEIGQHGAGERKGRGLHEIALDHEHADRAQHEAGEDRAAAHHL